MRYDFSPSEIANYAGDGSWLATLPLEFSRGSELSNDCGIGFRQVSLLVPQGSQENPSPYIAHHLVTTLGWPQPIFSTRSNWLQRTEFKHPTRGRSYHMEVCVAPDSEPGGSATTLHWSGIAFDTISFGLPALVLLMMTPAVVGRTGVWVRRTVVIVTAAWWLALVYPAWCVYELFDGVGLACPLYGMHPQLELKLLPSKTGQRITPQFSEEWLPVVHDWEKEPDARLKFEFEKVSTASQVWVPEEVWEQSLSRCHPESLALSELAVSWREYNYKMSHLIFQVRWAEEILAGWPMWSFSKGDGTYRLFVTDLSHLDVLWLPWLVNVSAMTAGVAAIYSVVVFIRHHRRRVPGHCSNCRYPLNGAAICPECGRTNAEPVKG